VPLGIITGIPEIAWLGAAIKQSLQLQKRGEQGSVSRRQANSKAKIGLKQQKKPSISTRFFRFNFGGPDGIRVRGA
jgi:hypothetical protein